MSWLVGQSPILAVARKRSGIDRGRNWNILWAAFPLIFLYCSSPLYYVVALFSMYFLWWCWLSQKHHYQSLTSWFMVVYICQKCIVFSKLLKVVKSSLFLTGFLDRSSKERIHANFRMSRDIHIQTHFWYSDAAQACVYKDRVVTSPPFVFNYNCYWCVNPIFGDHEWSKRSGVILYSTAIFTLLLEICCIRTLEFFSVSWYANLQGHWSTVCWKKKNSSLTC